MKVRIRRAAILFAVFSAIYWVLVSDLVGVASPLGGFGKQPYWAVALASMLPAIVYAIITLYFCHWFARRIIRDLNSAKGE